MSNYTVDQSITSPQQGYGFITTLIFPFFNTIGFPVTNSLGAFVYFATTGSSSAASPTTSAIDVSDYNNHVFQSFLATTGSVSGSIYLSSSIDGRNWIGETSFLVSNLSSSSTSSIYRPSTTGRRRYFMASFAPSGSGTITASLYLLAGQ